MSIVTLAQISDSHLFASTEGLHCQANVYQNLSRVFRALARENRLHAIVFTGDLTQDHSIESYQHFRDAFIEANFDCNLYWLAGNHDDPKLMATELRADNIQPAQAINFAHWQIVLLDSKSETPAGMVPEHELQRLSKRTSCANQLVMMHHHPEDVGYFIDRHNLKNQTAFWQAVNSNSAIRAIACGHVHQALEFNAQQSDSALPVFTCPATSIQFDPNAETVSALPLGAGFRLFNLHPSGKITSTVHYV